ncbi:NAD(P)-dependent dehydrogenase (short-subunit alcohol dehydrogenase family) [Bradyrhizobium sp. LM2.7]
MPHPAIIKDNVAVITGGASGIGLAAAMAFARAGMKVCIADVDQGRLAEAATKLSSVAAATNVMTFAVDVSKAESVAELERAVRERFGGTDVLMNNAGIQPGSTLFGEPDNWQRIIGVNMWGIINGSRIFAPSMGCARQGRPHHQHRLETGHHHTARRSRLQRLQGRCEGVHRGAPA